MAKNADGPPSGRMGFGYEQAREAGIPWDIVGPRPISEINADLRTRQKAREDETELKQLLSEHPQLTKRAEEMRRLRWSEEDLMYQLKIEAKEFRNRRLAREGKL
jgi:hypothetical protein